MTVGDGGGVEGSGVLGVGLAVSFGCAVAMAVSTAASVAASTEPVGFTPRSFWS